MPMGIVSNEEFESQLRNVEKAPPTPFVPPVPPVIPAPEDPQDPEVLPAETNTGEVMPFVRRGRKQGDNDVPDSLRKLIAETAHLEGRAAALRLAKDFGVSPSSVSAYTKGATSTTTYHQPKPDIIDFIRQRKGRVTKKALRVMQCALDELTPDKIASAKPKDISAIARDMGAIVGNMADKTTTENNNTGPTFVLYAPPTLQEDQFKAIPSGE